MPADWSDMPVANSRKTLAAPRFGDTFDAQKASLVQEHAVTQAHGDRDADQALISRVVVAAQKALDAGSIIDDAQVHNVGNVDLVNQVE